MNDPNYVPTGNCKTCRKRHECMAFCTAARRQEDKQTRRFEAQNRRIKKALLMQLKERQLNADG